MAGQTRPFARPACRRHRAPGLDGPRPRLGHAHQRVAGRLRARRALLRLRPRHRARRPAPGVGLGRLLPLRPLAAGVGDRPGLHLGEPRRRRDHGDVGQRCGVRAADGPLLLGRCDPGDALPRRRDDAVLLRQQGALGPRVHVPPLRYRRPPGQRAVLRARPAAHRRRQPLPARLHRARAARLAAAGRPARRRGDRPVVHHRRRAVGGDLQRGAAVLRHRRLRCCR